MPGIIDQLPDPKQLGELGNLFTFDAQALGFGGLEGLDVAGMASSIKGSAGGETLSGLSLPAPPPALTKDGFMASLNQPLAKLKSFDSNAALGDLSGGALPTSLPAPSFDLNTTIAGITTKILPGTPTVTAPPFDPAIPGLDLGGMVGPLNRLAQAGAATPTRLLFMLMRVGQSFVNTLTDVDTLVALTAQSLDEIYSQQILGLRARLPLYALDNGIRLLGPAAAPQAFSARYKLLLDEIETIAPTDVERLKRLLDEGRHSILPLVQDFEQSRLTLASLKANDTAPLTRALNNVLDLAAADTVLLQPYFDAIGAKSHTILGSITAPVKQIGDMAAQIQEYLTQAANTAESTAQTVSTQIATNLAKVEQFLQDAQARIEDIETQIKAFVEKLDVAPLVEKAKYGCAKIGEAVELFFTKVEELKLKLDEAVRTMEAQVDQKLTAAFQAVEQKIRELLGQITAILDRQEVKEALDQARQGIEKFKTTIEQASLKPVFDLVITQTGQLETSIKSLNVAQMSTPQKAALKVGVKVIEQVKVDEIIKPELLDAFEQIRAPLAELITLLKEKALEIEKIILEFNPGTVVNDYIVDSQPYQAVMKLLDDFRPSKLLAPLKEANNQLTAIVEQLNPDILIAQIQKIYEKIAGLLEIINPAPLNRLIGDAIEVATSTLGRIRDRELDSILATIKETISLENLIAQSGLQEIARADFWDMLQNYLGGGYLDAIRDAIDTVEQRLVSLAATLDFNRPLLLLRETVTAIDQQLVADATLISRRAGELRDAFARDAATLQQLEARRKAILARGPAFPELAHLLEEIDLAPVLQCQAATLSIAEWDAQPLGAAITAVNDILRPKVEVLRQMSAGVFQDAALVIFRKQISEPINKLIAQIVADLKPFKTALKKIQGILTTLTDLPPKIDAAVAGVLDTARDSLKQLITRTIAALQTFQQSLADTLNAIYARIQKIVGDLSPAWLLNSFAISDFAGGTAGPDVTPPGMLALARRIVSGADSGGLRIAALLQTKLSAGQLTLLQSETSESSTSLQPGNRANVLLAVNEALRDRSLAARETVDALKVGLDVQIRELQSKPQPTVEDIKRGYRCGALRRQISDAWVAYNSGEDKANTLVRLNRIILEAAYPDDISMSLQSLHPFIVENVAHLYPEQTVERLDRIYMGVVDKVKKLPDQLIRAPLDDEFNKIKAILKQNFDITGIFAVLEIKMDGLDEDLAQGLDRLSLAYNRLLETFDQRLAAA